MVEKQYSLWLENAVMDEDLIKEAFNKEPIEHYKQEQSKYLTNSCFEKMYDSYKIKKYEINYWEKNKNHFENRFRISADLKLLDSDTIKKHFCSIVVESKSKKRILRELSYVGIGADYIYPELEYTAKEIKRYYE